MLTSCVVFKTSAARILKFIILKLSKSDRFLLLFTSVIMTKIVQIAQYRIKKEKHGKSYL